MKKYIFLILILYCSTFLYLKTEVVSCPSDFYTTINIGSLAVESIDLDKIAKYLAEGGDPNCADQGRSLLTEVVFDGDREIYRTYGENDASKHIEIVKTIVNLGVDEHAKEVAYEFISNIPDFQQMPITKKFVDFTHYKRKLREILKPSADEENDEEKLDNQNDQNASDDNQGES